MTYNQAEACVVAQLMLLYEHFQNHPISMNITDNSGDSAQHLGLGNQRVLTGCDSYIAVLM